jgi:hypothetical protein
MITQVAFKTDAELKKSTLQKAKQEYITLKAVLAFFMKSYISGDIELRLAYRDVNGLTSDARDNLLSDLNDPSNSVTGSFKSKEELFSYLTSLSK